MAELDGETIIVTGASSGLGRSMAERFAAEGARVVLVARHEDALRDVAAGLDAEALVAPADVRNESEVVDAVDAAVERFEGVDALVNNAGVGLMRLYGRGKEVAAISAAEWNRILEVNLRGPFFFSKAVLPLLCERGGGNVINVTSTFATEPRAGWAPYVSSKFGLLGLTKTTAIEYENEGINVNSMHPGGKADTEFWERTSTDDRDDVLGADVMNEAAVLLAAQGPGGVTGEHHDAAGWERRLG